MASSRPTSGRGSVDQSFSYTDSGLRRITFRKEGAQVKVYENGEVISSFRCRAKTVRGLMRAAHNWLWANNWIQGEFEWTMQN